MLEEQRRVEGNREAHSMRSKSSKLSLLRESKLYILVEKVQFSVFIVSHKAFKIEHGMTLRISWMDDTAPEFNTFISPGVRILALYNFTASLVLLQSKTLVTFFSKTTFTTWEIVQWKPTGGLKKKEIILSFSFK